MRICQRWTLWLEINLIECIAFDCSDFCIELGLSQRHSVIFPNNNYNNNTVVSILSELRVLFPTNIAHRPTLTVYVFEISLSHMLLNFLNLG